MKLPEQPIRKPWNTFARCAAVYGEYFGRDRERAVIALRNGQFEEARWQAGLGE